jgi:hypothetical protein
MTRPTSLLRPAPLLEPAPPLPVVRNRVMWCDRCQTVMAHALNKSGTAYVCGCGEQIEYHVNAGPKMWAIR